jgi:hypothetical protein
MIKVIKLKFCTKNLNLYMKDYIVFDYSLIGVMRVTSSLCFRMYSFSVYVSGQLAASIIRNLLCWRYKLLLTVAVSFFLISERLDCN